jgi:hypothetical protein
MARASPPRVETLQPSKIPRRWSKRRLVVVVSSLIAGLGLLAVSVVGFAHSLGFVMRVADAVGDVGAIAPERVAPTGSAVTVTSPAASSIETSPPPRSAGGSDPGPRAVPAMPLPAGAGGGMAGTGGSGGAPATSDTPAETGGSGSAGTSSTGGVAGSAPSAWDAAVQSALALISQNTISMCGRNTCNTGQVCCNASCGVCVAPGETCDQQQCAGAPYTPTAVLCGKGQCNDGQVCCNPSCGICTAPGATCPNTQCR